MENLKNKKLDYLFLAFFVGIIAYSFGEATGRDNTKAYLFDSAYISSCDEKGGYCYLETKDGSKEISCEKYSKCLITPQTSEDIKREEIITDKEVEDLLNTLNEKN